MVLVLLFAAAVVGVARGVVDAAGVVVGVAVGC